MSDERIVRKHRTGGHHLGAGHDDARIGFLLHMAADVRHLVRRPVAVDGWMDDGVIDEGHAFLAVLVPVPGICLIRIVEIGVGAERRQEGCFIVRRPPQPAIRDARPFGNRVPSGDQLLHRFGRFEISVREASVARVGRQQQLVFVRRIVQRVIEASDHPGSISEAGMCRDVLHTLAVNIDFAPVAQGLEILLVVHRPVDCRHCFLLVGNAR